MKVHAEVVAAPVVVMFRVESPIDAFAVDTYLEGTNPTTSTCVRLVLSEEAEVVCDREFKCQRSEGGSKKS